jgi:hypothetical protein
MPTGITNMLTTACSNPWEKKRTVGPQIARSFPPKELDANDATTARLTIQLQRTALVKTVSRPAEPWEA